MSDMTRRFGLLSRLGLLFLAGVAAQPAMAQQAGVYSGITSQGGLVDVYIDESPSGDLVLSLMSHQIRSDCDAGADKRAWWFIPLFETPIGVDPVTSEVRASFLYEFSVMQFTPDGSALVGSFNITMPAFVDRKRSNWAVTRCITGPVTFRATWQPPTAAHAQTRRRLPSSRAVWVARADAQGRVTGWMLEPPAR